MPIENHSAFVMDRGGKRRLFEIKKLDYIRYSRLRDDMSTATIRLSNTETLAQADNLNSIEPGRHELCIYRQDQRMWEGPINIPEDSGDLFEVTAQDVLHYWNRTVMKKAWSSAYPKTEKAVTRIARIASAELARKEALGYNLLGYLSTYVDADDAQTSTSTKAYQATLFGHLDTLAARSGIDYTVVGRAVHIWDTSKAKMGTTPVVTQADFNSRVTVVKYGAETATRAIATDGRGLAGIAGGEDPYYGEIDHLAQAYDEQSGDEPPTQAELQSQATRNLKGRNPTPLVVRVPANASINTAGSLRPEFWVPGIYVPLRGKFAGKVVSQMQKMQQVVVTETSKGEQVQVSLYPASNEDGV